MHTFSSPTAVKRRVPILLYNARHAPIKRTTHARWRSNSRIHTTRGGANTLSPPSSPGTRTSAEAGRESEMQRRRCITVRARRHPTFREIIRTHRPVLRSLRLRARTAGSGHARRSVRAKILAEMRPARRQMVRGPQPPQPPQPRWGCWSSTCSRGRGSSSPAGRIWSGRGSHERPTARRVGPGRASPVRAGGAAAAPGYAGRTECSPP